MVGDIDAALADPHPLSMLALASSLAAAMDPTITTESSVLNPTEMPPVAEFVGMLAEGGELPTDALAWVVAHLALDDLTRARALRPVNSSRLPAWMLGLGNLEVYAAWQSIDVLRDGANVCFGFGVGEFDLTMVVFLDYNNGGAVKDGFIVEESLPAFQDTFTSLAPPGGMEFRDLEVADARAQVEAGLEAGKSFWPPFTSDSWPQMQPLLQLVLRFCPPGGASTAWPTWTDRQTDELIETFFHSDEARAASRTHEDRIALGFWIDFATHHGFGDPLLISGSKIEIFLLNSVLQTAPVGEHYKAAVPAVLHAFVPFAHARRGIDPTVTAETLATLERVTPQFLAGVDHSDAPPEQFPLTPDGNLDLEQMFRNSAAAEVGGLEQLDSLDEQPLPPEELELGDVDDDLHARLRLFDAMAEEACQVFEDPEVLIAVRRLTHDIAVADPEVFRRKAKDANTAAALSMLVARANGLVGSFGAVQSKDFLARFGVTSVGTRAGTLRAVLIPRHHESQTALGSPRYLTSTYRHHLKTRLEVALEHAREMARKVAEFR